MHCCSWTALQWCSRPWARHRQDATPWHTARSSDEHRMLLRVGSRCLAGSSRSPAPFRAMPCSFKWAAGCVTQRPTLCVSTRQTSPSATCKPSTALGYFDQHLCALGMAAMGGEFQPAVTVADAVVGELNSVHAPVRDEMRCVVVALAYQGSISTCRSGAWAPRCVSV